MTKSRRVCCEFIRFGINPVYPRGAVRRAGFPGAPAQRPCRQNDRRGRLRDYSPAGAPAPLLEKNAKMHPERWTAESTISGQLSRQSAVRPLLRSWLGASSPQETFGRASPARDYVSLAPLAPDSPDEPDGQRDQQNDPPENTQFARGHLDKLRRARKKQQEQPEHHPQSSHTTSTPRPRERFRGTGWGPVV